MKEEILRFIQGFLLIGIGIIIGYLGYLSIAIVGFVIFLAMIIIKDSFKKTERRSNVRRIKTKTSK